MKYLKQLKLLDVNKRTIKHIFQTLVLELAVMTELTEDAFYDDGNLANNLAALLGIDPSKELVNNVDVRTSFECVLSSSTPCY